MSRDMRLFVSVRDAEPTGAGQSAGVRIGRGDGATSVGQLGARLRTGRGESYSSLREATSHVTHRAERGVGIGCQRPVRSHRRV